MTENYTAEAAIHAVAQAWGVSSLRVFSRDRAALVAEARMAAYYILRENGHTASSVGRAMGRDHAAVLMGARRIAELLGGDPKLKGRLSEAYRILKENPAPATPLRLEEEYLPELTYRDACGVRVSISGTLSDIHQFLSLYHHA